MDWIATSLKVKKMNEDRGCCVGGLRYVALILWCIIILGLYFGYDIPGSLQNQIMSHYGISSYKFAYFYSVYSWPNIVMCFIGGFLIDRVIGVRMGLIVFCSISALGMVVFIIGANVNILLLMFAGRFIFGIGCESSTVAMNNYAVVWFSGKEQNMVFAIMMNMGRIGSSLVFQSSEPAFDAISKTVPKTEALGYTLILLGSISFIPVLCAIAVAYLKPKQELSEDHPVEDLDVQTESKEGKSEPKSVVRFLDFISFPLQFWLLNGLISIYLAIIYSFLGLSQTAFTKKFGVSDNTANSYVSFYSFFGAVLSPCLGIIVDKKGRNLYFLMLSYVTGIIGLILIAFTYVSPFLSMFFMSVSMASILCSIWALFPYIIPDHQIGTAFGIVQSGINISLSFGSVAAGAIADKYGYQMMEAFILACIVASTPMLILSWILDLRGTKVLNMSSHDRDIYLEDQKKSESRTSGTYPNLDNGSLGPKVTNHSDDTPSYN